MRQHQFQYKFTPHAVAFLDVLGFQSKLAEFDQEARYNFEGFEVVDTETAETVIATGPLYYSPKATEFIETFEAAISKLDPEKFKHYLFSDNICITVQNDGNNEENTLIELLLIISELYYEFVQRGYFLRGGVDYGLFIDKSSIAVGLPLANAYKMENTQAVFPRILLSENFTKQLLDYTNDSYSGYASLLSSSLIKASCELRYLNVFNHIFKVEDKEAFFEKYNSSILTNMVQASQHESIFLKYQWLADEFNAFIDSYTSNLAFLDENFEPSDEFIDGIRKLKVLYG